MEVVIASTNKGKISEIRKILSGLEIEILSLDDFSQIPTIIEDGCTFEENAVKKATAISKLTGKVTLADDSGLEVDCLNGAPGITSARFGGDGLNDAERNQKLLELLKEVSDGERKARFKCVLAIACPDGKINTVCGECQGLISLEVRGNQGFGYDPIFIPDGYSKTFGELGGEIKDKISHRARALFRAREVLLEIIQKVKQK
ncbi:MAG: XTP/dITP diphosphatase [bacterium]|nr:XTP/dITP diphosphatase [bacterium]